jgi:site-specific recombinase XerD
MAKIKFILQGKSKNTQIYLRLSISKNVSFKRKTGYSIDFKDWSQNTGFPKPNNPISKNLKVDLKALETFVESELNRSNSEGVEVTSLWLNESIAKCLGRSEVKELDYLVAYAEKYIDNLKYKSSNNEGRGVSISTIKKRRTVLNKLIKFEVQAKRRLKVKDIDLAFRMEFIDFLNKVELLSEGTIGRYLKEVKTICNDAQKNGVEVSPLLIHFKGFTTTSFKTVLSFSEIEMIQGTEFKDEKLCFARDWLVIGCYTGQRVSDLLRMNTTMIEEHYGFEFISLTQKKTKKLVQIPIHQKVKHILESYDGKFPPTFSRNEASNSAMFNRCLKTVSKDAGLTGLIQGKLRSEDSGRQEEGEYPKYKLVSSHICRRSFATNFYAQEKYPTPILMNITAHGTEKMFLSYIGKKPIDYGVQLARIWQSEGGVNS